MKVLLLLLLLSTNGLAQDAVEILRKSDEIRFPSESFEVDVNIVSTGTDSSTRVVHVMSKGNVNSIVFTKEPAIDYGQAILMKGRDLWIFMPDLSQAIRLSMSQRLTGQVANGDLARANFSGDYNPTIAAEEDIDGQKYFILDLQAVDRGVTYSRVRLWVNQANYWPKKAEFFSLSGRLLKTCQYLDFQRIAGKMRPTRLLMVDAMKTGDTSDLKYSGMKLNNFPDKIFTKDYLNKIANGI